MYNDNRRNNRSKKVRTDIGIETGIRSIPQKQDERKEMVRGTRDTSSFYHSFRSIRESLCEEYLPENDHAVVPVKRNTSETITIVAARVTVSINGNATYESIRAVIEIKKS